MHFEENFTAQLTTLLLAEKEGKHFVILAGSTTFLYHLKGKILGIRNINIV